MKLVNLTPHTINVWNDDGTPVLEIEPSGNIARCKAGQVAVDYVSGVSVVRSIFSPEIENLPEPQTDKTYIVSSLVAQHPHIRAARPDVVVPDTGPTAFRNEDGDIIAVRRFQVFGDV